MTTSELVWGMKNGDLDTVKEIVEKNVSSEPKAAHPVLSQTLLSPPRCSLFANLIA